MSPCPRAAAPAAWASSTAVGGYLLPPPGAFDSQDWVGSEALSCSRDCARLDVGLTAVGGSASSWFTSPTANSYTAFTAGDYHCTVTASNAAGSVTQTSAAHVVAATTAAGGALVRPTISALRETR
jgi:hypothetical protein